MQLEKDQQKFQSEATVGANEHNVAIKVEESLSPSKAYFRLWKYAKFLDWVLRVIAIFAALGGGTAYPLMTIVFGNLVNDFNAAGHGNSSPSAFRASINHNALWFVYLFLGKFGLVYIADFLFCFTATRMARKIRLRYLKRVLHQPISYFDLHSSGSIATNLSTDTNIIEIGLADKVATVFQGAGMIIGALAIAFTKSWKMTLVVGTTIPYVLITTIILGSIDSSFETRQRESYSEASKMAEEAPSSVADITALGAKDKIVKNFDEPLTKAGQFGMKIGPVQATMYGNMFFSMQSGYALALYYGVKLISNNEIKDGGTVMVVLFCMILGSSAMGIVSPTIPYFLKAAASAQQVLNILGKAYTDITTTDNPSGEDIKTVRGHLSLQHVSFHYPARPTTVVLDNLSLEVPAGKTTAIVGHSGSGKSTIISLLERWYNPTEGSILLDGINIEQLNISSMRDQIGLVQQDPMLFNDTIFQNILNGYHGSRVEKLSEKERNQFVINASIQVNAHGFIEQLPQGYNTIVGERAGLLSGGQKQRIAIARSIISNPKILLLDEATSALDSESERSVQEALDRASLGRTTLIVAHKLSTIEKADKIVVMDKGKIVEEGTHLSLLQSNGVYCQLLSAQSQSSKDEEETTIIKPEAEPVLVQTMSSQPKISKILQPDEHLISLDSKIISRRWNILRCVLIILNDTRNVLPAFFGGTIVACIAGAVLPVQAFLFSRLVTLFQLTGALRTNRANFWAAMFQCSQ